MGRSGGGEVPHYRNQAGRADDARHLDVRRRPFFAVLTRLHRNVHSAHRNRFGIVGGACRLKGEDTEFRQRRNPEFLGIEFQFRPIGISCRIVRSRLVPVASGERRRGSVEKRDSAGERGSGIVDDVVSRGIPRGRGFGRYGRIYRSDVRFRRGVFSVLRVSGERQEPYGRENGQNGDDHDELGEREGPIASVRFGIRYDGSPQEFSK